MFTRRSVNNTLEKDLLSSSPWHFTRPLIFNSRSLHYQLLSTVSLNFMFPPITEFISRNLYMSTFALPVYTIQPDLVSTSCYKNLERVTEMFNGLQTSSVLNITIIFWCTCMPCHYMLRCKVFP